MIHRCGCYFDIVFQALVFQKPLSPANVAAKPLDNPSIDAMLLVLIMLLSFINRFVVAVFCHDLETENITRSMRRGGTHQYDMSTDDKESHNIWSHVYIHILTETNDTYHAIINIAWIRCFRTWVFSYLIGLSCSSAFVLYAELLTFLETQSLEYYKISSAARSPPWIAYNSKWDKLALLSALRNHLITINWSIIGCITIGCFRSFCMVIRMRWMRQSLAAMHDVSNGIDKPSTGCSAWAWCRFGWDKWVNHSLRCVMIWAAATTNEHSLALL